MHNKLRFNLVAMIWLLVVIASPLTGKSQVRAKPDVQVDFIESSWLATLKKAKEEHKYIFVDTFATWCGPCRQMKSTTFKNKEVAAFFNKNFVNLSIDAEKGEGVELAEKWGLESYPTVYIFDSTGKMVSSTEGFADAAGMMKFGKSVVVNQVHVKEKQL